MISATLVAYAENIGDSGGEWINTTNVYQDIYGKSGIASDQQNKILTDVYYENGMVCVFLTPYIQGKYDETHNKDALGKVTVNVYEDSESNWINNENNNKYRNLVTTGTVDCITMNQEGQTLKVPIDNMPATYFIEAIYELKDDSSTIITERVTSAAYTDSIDDIRNDTIANYKAEHPSVSDDYIEQLNKKDDTDTENFAVYRLDSALVTEGTSYTIEKTGTKNVVIIQGVPQQILDQYPTSEALSRVPQLLFRGSIDDEHTKITVDADGGYLPIPIECTAYRAKVDNPKTYSDYEFKYNIEYVYEGGSSTPTGGPLSSFRTRFLNQIQ